MRKIIFLTNQANHIIFFIQQMLLSVCFLQSLPVTKMKFRLRWRAAAKRSTMTEKLNEKMNNISKSFRKVTISHQDLRRTSSTSSTNSKTSTRFELKFHLDSKFSSKKKNELRASFRSHFETPSHFEQNASSAHSTLGRRKSIANPTIPRIEIQGQFTPLQITQDQTRLNLITFY